MKRILVASDLSQRSDRAIHRAFRIAARLGARVDIAHVVDDDLPDDIVHSQVEQAQAALDRFTTIVPQAAGTSHTVHVRPGDVPGEIRAIAEDTAADLVVIGTHRSRPFMDLFRETTMQRLARISPAPVLLVRDAADHDYERVLAAIDCSPASAAVCRAARTLVPDARINGFHAVHVPYRGSGSGRVHNDARFYVTEAREQLAEWGRANDLADIAAETEISDGGLGPGFQRALAHAKPDLIALGAHSRPQAVSFVLGSFIVGLMQDPPRDILVAHPSRHTGHG